MFLGKTEQALIKYNANKVKVGDKIYIAPQ